MQKIYSMERRKFLVRSASVVGSLFLPGLPVIAKDGHHLVEGRGSAKKKILARIGICADVHQDLMHDGERRIKAFIDEWHHHQDYYNFINGIHYVQINSMSYFWMGSKYRQFRYNEKINKEHPWIKDIVPYKDPILAFLTTLPGF